MSWKTSNPFQPMVIPLQGNLSMQQSTGGFALRLTGQNLQNSALEKCKFHAIKIEILCSKIEILHLEMWILHSKTALIHHPEFWAQKMQTKNRNSTLERCKFCTQKLQLWHSKQSAQNSALRKWKFCVQEMEIPCSKKVILHSGNGKFTQCHGKSAFPWF